MYAPETVVMCRKGRQCQQGLGHKEVEVEEMNLELSSSPPLPLPQEQDPPPSVGPLVHHLLPPPSPTAGGQKRSAYKEIAPKTGPEYS